MVAEYIRFDKTFRNKFKQAKGEWLNKKWAEIEKLKNMCLNGSKI